VVSREVGDKVLGLMGVMEEGSSISRWDDRDGIRSSRGHSTLFLLARCMTSEETAARSGTRCLLATKSPIVVSGPAHVAPGRSTNQRVYTTALPLLWKTGGHINCGPTLAMTPHVEACNR